MGSTRSGTDRLTTLGRRWAALLRVGDPAWISHRTLAAAYGLDLRAPLDVDALSPSRLVVDLAGQLAQQPLTSLVGELQRRDLLDLDALAASASRARGRPNLPVLTRIVREAEDAPPTRSELERRFAPLLARAGIADADHDAHVVANGRPYEIDVLVATRGLAIELDGRRYQEVLADFERDRAKDADLTVAGLRPVRFTWRRVVHRADEVAATPRALVGEVDAVRWHHWAQVHPPAAGAAGTAVGDWRA